MIDKIKNIKNLESGNFFLIAGPCAIEGEEMAFQIAEKILEITNKLKIPFIQQVTISTFQNIYQFHITINNNTICYYSKSRIGAIEINKNELKKIISDDSFIEAIEFLNKISI